MPTFDISIDRTSLSLAPLEMSGNDGATTALKVTTYRAPAMQARVKYAPSSEYVHGDVPLAWSWQQAILTFDVTTRGAATEAAAKAAVAELVEAVARLSYTVTVTEDGVVEAWACDPGTVAPRDDRNRVDLEYHSTVWTVSIPCHPIRSVA
jgi:hypothetical protein